MTAELAPAPEDFTLADVFASLADAALLASLPERRVVCWNRQAEELLGWTEDRIVGQPLDAILTAATRRRMARYLEETVAGADDVIAFVPGGVVATVMVQHRNGSERAVHASIAILAKNGRRVLLALFHPAPEQQASASAQATLALVDRSVLAGIDRAQRVTAVLLRLIDHGYRSEDRDVLREGIVTVLEALDGAGRAVQTLRGALARHVREQEQEHAPSS